MFLKTLHLNLIVSDFSLAHRFYTEVLEFEEVRRFEIGGADFQKGVGIEKSGAKVAHLKLPGGALVLEISEYTEGRSTEEVRQKKANQPGFRHVALRVSDIMSSYERLVEKGVRFVSEPVTVSQPESLRGFRFCYFFDPDGNIWELNQAP